MFLSYIIVTGYILEKSIKMPQLQKTLISISKIAYTNPTKKTKVRRNIQ